MPPESKKKPTPPVGRNIGKATPTPVIVIHGGPASNLLDLYLTTPEDVFTLGRGFLNVPRQHKRWDRVPLHPDDERVTLNTTGSTITPARLAALNAFFLPY